MAKAKGMPIPSDEVDGLLCLRLIIPNSPHWLRVVDGTIYKMTRGRYWDESTGSILDTQQIALAIYSSIQTGDCGCNDSTDDCLNGLTEINETIQQLQETINDMQTIVNVNNYNGGCGCNGGSDGGTTATTGGGVLPSGWGDIDWNGDYPMSQELPPDDEGYLAYKCNASNEVVTAIRNGAVQIVGLVEAGEDETEAIQEILVSSLAWLDQSVGTNQWFTSIWATFYLFSTYVINSFTSALSISVVNWIDDNNSDLVNALYCAENHTESYDNFRQLVDVSGLSLVANQFVKLLLKMVSLQALYYAIDDRPEIGDYGFACSCEGDPPPVEYDYDVTFDLGTGEPFMEFITDHPRSGVVDGKAYINARDDFQTVPLGLSHNGLKAVIESVLGVGSFTSATLEAFHFLGTGNQTPEGGGNPPPTCADGYDHDIVTDGGIVQESGIIVTCPDSLWYGTSGFSVDLEMGGDTGSIVEIIQNHLDTVATNGSQLDIFKMRVRGSVVA